MTAASQLRRLVSTARRAVEDLETAEAMLASDPTRRRAQQVMHRIEGVRVAAAQLAERWADLSTALLCEHDESVCPFEHLCQADPTGCPCPVTP